LYGAANVGSSFQAAFMFVEDVILGGLKAGSSWFVSDHLLRGDAKTGIPMDAAKEIADRNDLRFERVVVGGSEGVRFWKMRGKCGAA
jgi:hypothetical protein